MPTSNTLQPGLPRVGWLIDGDPNTPLVGVTLLESAEHGIELTIPLQGPAEPYGQWFIGTVFQFRNAVGDPLEPRTLPTYLQFKDSFGDVTLVGCRVAGANIGMGLGTGRISVTHAVLGGTHLNYDKVNGVRTVIPHLARSTGASITQTAARTDGANYVVGLDVTTTTQEPIRVSRTGNLTLQGLFTTSDELGPDTTLIYDRMTVQTSWAKPRAWLDHLDLHEAILELLTIAAWQRFGFQELSVSRSDESTGRDRPLWLPVATHAIPRPDPNLARPSFLFTLADIGPTGMRRWLRMAQYSRAILPFIRLINLEGLPIEAQFIQSSIALESLGYAMTDPKTLNQRGQLEFRKALTTVYKSLHLDLFDDPKAWVANVAACYRGVNTPTTRILTFSTSPTLIGTTSSFYGHGLH